MGMHQATVSRIIPKVSSAIASLAGEFIQMPQRAALVRVHNDFYNIARFPRVAGCIDCTHIKIRSPGGEDAEVFRNRKLYFSLNTQVVCDSHLKINNIVARWPGSAHDITIYNNSGIRAQFEAGEFGNSILLGDSGYMLRPYFLTPFRNPATRAERLYNESHIRTRNTVERCFGVWKRRFPVLAYGLRLKVESCQDIIVAAAVLHNKAVEMNEGVPPVPDNINAEELEYLIQQGHIPNLPQNAANVNNALNFRQSLVNNYFANL